MDSPITVQRYWLLLKGQHAVIKQAEGAVEREAIGMQDKKKSVNEQG